jgi:hypothetical protein
MNQKVTQRLARIGLRAHGRRVNAKDDTRHIYVETSFDREGIASRSLLLLRLVSLPGYQPMVSQKMRLYQQRFILIYAALWDTTSPCGLHNAT